MTQHCLVCHAPLEAADACAFSQEVRPRGSDDKVQHRLILCPQHATDLHRSISDWIWTHTRQDRARADHTLARMPVISDFAIHEALTAIED